MSHPEERFAVVILSNGQVVRLLGRGYPLSLALALVRSARQAPEPDGIPAIVPQWLDLEIEAALPQRE
jgi:hypothetical protein